MGLILLLLIATGLYAEPCFKTLHHLMTGDEYKFEINFKNQEIHCTWNFIALVEAKCLLYCRISVDEDLKECYHNFVSVSTSGLRNFSKVATVCDSGHFLVASKANELSVKLDAKALPNNGNLDCRVLIVSLYDDHLTRNSYINDDSSEEWLKDDVENIKENNTNIESLEAETEPTIKENISEPSKVETEFDDYIADYYDYETFVHEEVGNDIPHKVKIENRNKTGSCYCGIMSKHYRMVDGDKIEWLYPFMAAIVVKGIMKVTCTAVFITQKYALASAHCYLSVKKRPLAIFAGKFEISIDDLRSANYLHEIENVMVHPLYESKTTSHDIAIVKIKDVMIEYASTELACIPFHLKGNTFADEKVEVVYNLKAWEFWVSFNEINTKKNDLEEDSILLGYINLLQRLVWRTMQDIFKKVWNSVRRKEVSRREILKQHTREMVVKRMKDCKLCDNICLNNNGSVTQSGGPILWINSEKRVVLIGIGRFGSSNSPNKHIKLSKYIPWILENTDVETPICGRK